MIIVHSDNYLEYLGMICIPSIQELLNPRLDVRVRYKSPRKVVYPIPPGLFGSFTACMKSKMTPPLPKV